MIKHQAETLGLISFRPTESIPLSDRKQFFFQMELLHKQFFIGSIFSFNLL